MKFYLADEWAGPTIKMLATSYSERSVSHGWGVKCGAVAVLAAIIIVYLVTKA